MGDKHLQSAWQSGTGDAKNQRSNIDRKFWIALLLYAVLGAVAWFTMDEGKVLVAGRFVQMRWIPLVVLGGFALRTVLARSAERIRSEGQK